MALSAYELQQHWATNPDVVANAFTKTLTEFGYCVSQENVKAWIIGYYAGEKPAGGPAMFVHGWLRKGVD